MSDGINGKIGEEGQEPLLVIADDSEESTPALIAVEEAPAEAPLPAPAVEAIVTAVETAAPVSKPAASAATPAPVAPVTPPAAAAATVAAAVPEPAIVAEAPVSAPLPQPAVEADAVAPAAVVKPKRMIPRWVPLATVSMAVFASSLSVVGLLVASRTLAETKIVLEQVQAHQAKMRRLDKVIEEVDALRDREQIALHRLEMVNAGKPVTAGEVRAAISGLQLAMAKYQPDNLNATLTNIRDGQYELAERISTIYRRVEKIDEQMSKGAASSSPKAKREAGREPTS